MLFTLMASLTVAQATTSSYLFYVSMMLLHCTRSLINQENLRKKLFVGDMSDWLNKGGCAHVTTVADNESNYTKTEVKRARDAWKLICN